MHRNFYSTFLLNLIRPIFRKLSIGKQVLVFGRRLGPIFSLAEDGAADSDVGTAHRDRLLEVVGHPHRQLQAEFVHVQHVGNLPGTRQKEPIR